MPTKKEKNTMEKEKTKTKKISQKEIEEKIIELAEKGMTSEKIGEELRNQNIHTKEYNIKISRILKKKGKYINPDLKNLEEKLEKIKEHLEKNKQDKRAEREKSRIFSQLRKLKKHFKVAIK